MNAYQKMLEAFSKADEKTLLATARTAAQKLLDYCESIHVSGFSTLLNVAICGVAIDGKLTDKEQRFLSRVLDVKEEQLTKADTSAQEMAESVDRFADAAPKEIKGAILTLIVCISMADGSISAKENALIRIILA